jgi:HEAT repeat protein
MGFASILGIVASWRSKASEGLLRTIAVPLAIALGAAACVASPAQRAISRGDRAALYEAIAVRERDGKLSNGEAASLAKAVAARELRTASGADAVDRVGDARPCAHELDSVLAARMRTHDTAGAQAALARIEGGGLDVDDVRAFAQDQDPPWRAIAARALVRAEDRDARLRALVDPEPLVRREAARAARDARAPADLGALAEAARVDPEPIVRTEAVRAIAALPAAPDGSVVAALRDLWTSADEGLREDIALTWSGSGVWGLGGRDALYVVVASEQGLVAVEAAAAVLRRRDADVEVARAALAQFARAIQSGSRATRLHALARAPLDRPVLLALVQKAADDEDLEVRVGALARLAESKDAKALGELESLARPGSPVARRARFALAISHDRRVQLWIEDDLQAKRPELRLAAATELAAMGVAARAAPLLADEDARVRVRAACTMIMAARMR